MNQDEYAIVRGLVPVAWSDGHFAEKEKEMLEALCDAYGASDDQKAELRSYADEPRTLDDIDLQSLSTGDRRVLLQCAVLLALADGTMHPAESAFLTDLSKRLRIPGDEATNVMAAAEARAKKSLERLG
jgi:uncharacterized membrane protein YebE (DUF533 family)